MANVDYPHGLMPITFGARVRRYKVDSSNATRIGLNDPVKMENDGCVTLAAATNTILGVVTGVFNKGRVPIIYLAASISEVGYVDVCDDPNALFVIQDDDSTVGTGTVAADVGVCCDILATNCDTTSGLSKVEMNITTVSGTDGQLRIVGLWLDPKNAWGTHADTIVLINEHFYKTETGV